MESYLYFLQVKHASSLASSCH